MMGSTWSRVDLYTREDGTVLAECSTNDNRDQGYDSEDAYWTLQHPSKESALKQHGKCRVGISGIKVIVTLDGEEVR